jgi:DNA-binding beta-propeller fold protein YncE
MFHLPSKIKTQHKYLITAVSTIVLLAGCAGGDVKQSEFELAYPPPPDEPRFVFERMIRSSFDVKEITGADKLRQFATGTMGNAEGLSKPWGVAVHKGRIYVTDTVKRAVLMFDVPGKKFATIGTEGPGALRKPIGIDVANDGEIYVVDNTAKRVIVYDGDGNYLRAFGSRDILHRPSGVAVNPSNTRAYVIDTGGVDTQEHHLYVFDSQTGELLRTVGNRGKEEGDFNLPLQVTSSPDGTVYVSDAGNFRVQSFDEEGNFIASYGTVGRKVGNFARPKGIATGPNGNIYVVDAAFGNFQIFTKQFKLLMFIGDRGERLEPGKYLLPAGIDVDEDGRIYMIDQYFRKLDIFRPADIGENDGYLGGAHLTKK